MGRRMWQIIIGTIAVLLSLPMILSIYENRSMLPIQIEALKYWQYNLSNITEANSVAPIVNSKQVIQNAPYYIVPNPRKNRSISVTIVIVITVGTKKEAFETAINSIECYAAVHGYSVSVQYDDKFDDCKVHKDKFFRRHCHTHKLMQTHIKEGEWALFIDGDVAVVNPNRLIEEYIEEGFEIYLFDRFYNWEYAAQYLVKNNDRGRGWVEEFSKYEFKLPRSFHGTDNGALHPFLMLYLVPEAANPNTRSRMADLCLSLWNRSSNYEDLFGMQACTRMVIGERTHFPDRKVKIFQKGYGWAHDLWIFHSHWATDDFMMHSVKEQQLKPYPSDEAGQKRCRSSLLNYEANDACHSVFPVLKKLNVEKCKAGTEGWLLEGRLQIDNDLRRKIYDDMAYKILRNQMTLVGKTAAKITT